MIKINARINHVMQDEERFYAWVQLDNIYNRRINVARSIYEYVKDEGYGLYELSIKTGITISGSDYVSLETLRKLGGTNE